MKLITLQCPKCGSKLEVNSELTRASCNYCGNDILIDDEAKRVKVQIDNARQMGYDFEQGRMRAKNSGPNKELANLIQALTDPVCAVSDLQARAIFLENNINELRMKEPDTTSVKGMIKPFVIPAIIVLFLIMSGDIKMILFGLVIAAGIYFFRKYTADKAEVRRREDIFSCERELRSVRDSINKINDSLKAHRVDLIPPSYRNRQAMEFFYSAIMNQRAYNMSQAVNLYEEEMHRSEMRALQARQVQLQMEQKEMLKDIKRTGKTTAAATVILTAGSMLDSVSKL